MDFGGLTLAKFINISSFLMIKWGGDDLICLIRKKSNMMKYQAFEPPFNTGPSSCDSLMMKEGGLYILGSAFLSIYNGH